MARRAKVIALAVTNGRKVFREQTEVSENQFPEEVFDNYLKSGHMEEIEGDETPVNQMTPVETEVNDRTNVTENNKVVSEPDEVPAPGPEDTRTDEERKAAEDAANKQLEDQELKTRAELMEKLDKEGIKYKKDSPNKDLYQLLLNKGKKQ